MADRLNPPPLAVGDFTVIPVTVAAAIRKIVDYNWADEEQDYAEWVQGDGADHPGAGDRPVKDITISYLTLSGASYGHPAKHPPLARARAAADAGLTSLGVEISEVNDLLQNRKEILDLVRIPECEWVNLGSEDPYYGSPAQFEPLRILAGEFGVTRVNCGVCDGKTTKWQAAQRLISLCEDVAEPGLGMTVAVEPVAFGSLPLLQDILDVLQLAGKPENAGVLVDLWQLSWPGYWDELPKGPVSWPVAEIQLCGSTRWGARREVSLNEKRWPDPRIASQERRTINEARLQGQSPGTWLRKFRPYIRRDVPLSYEVPRSDWRDMPLERVAQLVAEDIRSLDA